MTRRGSLAGALPHDRLGALRELLAARGIASERMRRGSGTTALRVARRSLALSKLSAARKRPAYDGRSTFKATARPRFVRADGRPSRMAFEAPRMVLAGPAPADGKRAPR